MRLTPDGQIRHHSAARFTWIVALLLVTVLILAACGGGNDQAEAPAEEPTAAVEAPTGEAEAPAEEEATPEAEDESEEAMEDEATAEPEEEETAEAEEEAAEDMEATPDAEEESMTPEPEEEAEATAEPEEEAMDEAEEEATAEPDEEATAEPEEEAAMGGDAEAGGYLFTIARGCGCHFNRDLEAYAGGLEFDLPGGAVYALNITPDEETGIGSLTEAEVAHALQTGAIGDYQLHPIMPYHSYAVLSDEDALNLAAYLFSLEPVVNEVPARDSAIDPEPFTPATAPPAMSPTDPVARGEMLVALARCGQCHTPTNEDGSPNMDMFLAGKRLNEDEIAWNITPDEDTGIGGWDEEELATFLRTGTLSDGSEIVGTMATQIERYFSSLTEDDAAAIAAYLMSLPPVENDPE